MNLTDYLRRQSAYDEWANREVVEAIRAAGADPRSVELVAHILSAERLWLERLKSQPQNAAVWPKTDLAACEAQAGEMARLWRDYLQEADDSFLAGTIRYRNSKGEEWTSTVIDVLTHVVMHSAYHRGQIASHMRAAGKIPPYTDFIHGVRQGFVK